MRFKTSREEIVKTIQSVQNAISSKSTLPILSNILLETTKNKTKITATDLDIGISATMKVQSETEGAITIPAKKFFDIVKELPDSGAIYITAKKNNTVTLECGKIFFKIIGLPKDEFPQPPSFTNKEALKISQKDLQNMIEMTSFAVSRDETRYVLNGVLTLIKETTIKMVATDGRRLAVIEQTLDKKTALNKKVIIPTKAIQELSRLLEDTGEVEIVFNENQVLFNLGDTVIISRLIEGEFPNYEQVIPKEAKEKAVVDRNALLAATKRASLLTNQDSVTIQYDISHNKMTVSKNTHYMGEVKEELGISYKGKDISIGFNPHYIIEVLKNIETESVGLEIVDNDKPGVIRLGNEYVYVVLPMQIV